MDDIQAELFNFDFRGPASSEALNEFMGKISNDMGVLIDSSYTLRNNYKLLSDQTRKQTLALSRKLATITDRDNGANCKANLSDGTVLLTTDRDGVTIPTSSRLVHKQEFPIIMPPTTFLNWLARTDGTNTFIADGVETNVQVISESGTPYYIPTELAIAGDDALFYERVLSSISVLSVNPEISVFVSVPQSKTGMGYPDSNFLTYFPFPLYTTSMRVYYTDDTEPTLSVAGSSWHDWPTYIASLYNNDVYSTESVAVYSSFPTTNITAIRFDIKQPFYLAVGGNYIWSYGLGMVQLGLVKSSVATASGTVRIDKPTGNFTSIATDDAVVTLDNVVSADIDDVLDTYAWIDPDDASIAYVELTLHSDVLENGQVPIIKEVSVDYI
jgi:hypothetical protein